MLKYVDTKVVFQEVPDEITLAINISNCPCHCKGCHSPYLAEDIGTPLTTGRIEKLIKDNKGITCVALMGGDSDPLEVKNIGFYIKSVWGNIKVAWYSGRSAIPEDMASILYFDYIKIGPYIEECGPLNSKTTNQRLYKVHNDTLEDITSKFWK